MTNIAVIDLAAVAGGQATSFNQIREQAQAWCPQTAQRYSHVDPAKVTRPQAQQMGNECLAEMNPLKRLVASGPIQAGIDKAFPRK